MNKNIRFEKQDEKLYLVNGQERVPIEKDSNRVTIGGEEVTLLTLAEQLYISQEGEVRKPGEAQNKYNQRGVDQSPKTERTPATSR